MFDPQNVADFIRTCMQQAPNVEYYALVFGDHGGGFSVTSDYDKSTPAASAALKKVTDFLVKQDVSNVDAYIKAACSCYQFYNKEPFYDVVSYLKALKTNVFPNNAEYAALLQEAETAIRAAIAGHADYCYELDPTGKSVGSLLQPYCCRQR